MLFAVACGIPPVYMMRKELRTGYCRWRDYLFVVPVLCGMSFLFYRLAGFDMPQSGWPMLLAQALRLFLMFWAMSIAWGASLMTGALLVRGIGKAFGTNQKNHLTT